MKLFNKNSIPGLRNGTANVYTKGSTRKRESRDRDVYRQRDVKRGNTKIISSQAPIYFVTVFVGIVLLFLLPLIAGGCLFVINVFIGINNNMDFSTLSYWSGFWWLLRKPMADATMLVVYLVLMMMVYAYMHDNWRLENITADNSDINDYENDSMLQEPEQLVWENDLVPDAFAHYDADVTALLSHQHFTNRGLKRWENNKKEIFDGKFSEALYDSDSVPKEVRLDYHPKDISYNPEKRHGKPAYDNVAEVINKTWTLPDYEGGRPGGAYVADTGPSNTMVIASTRAGKGNNKTIYV